MCLRSTSRTKSARGARTLWLTAALLVLPASRANAAASGGAAGLTRPDSTEPQDAPSSAETAAQSSVSAPAATAETSPETQAYVAIPEPEPATPYADPAPKSLRGIWMGTSFHTRTGWFARGNLGASYLHIFRSAASTQLPDSTGTEAFKGSSSVDTVLAEAELSAGGSFARDIGLGFVARISEAQSASLSTSNETLDLRGGLSVSFLGITALLYPDSELGWFVGASAGFERWRARVEEKALDEIGGNGVALSLYFGRDFWLGSNVAVGGLVRIDGGAYTGNTDRQVDQDQLRGTETDYSLKGALAVTLTYY